MRKHFLLIVSTLAVLFLAGGCAQELKEDVATLRKQVIELEERVNKFNSDLTSLSALINALESNDHIMSVTEFSALGRTGYRITFTSLTSILVLNGTNGIQPIIGVRYNEQSQAYYWTIQMGPDASPTWMTNSMGQRVRATSTTPVLKIEDGIWWYSFDGTSWVKSGWGPAQGEDGKPFFSSIDTSDPYYVVFTLADRTVFKIATQKGFDELSALCTTVNQQMETYTELVAGLDSNVFIKSVSELQEDGETVGYNFVLEDGRVMTIRNGRDYADSLQLCARKDVDNFYYWSYRTDPAAAYAWIMYNGKKVPVSPQDGTPYIGITDSLGVLYFTISYQNGETEMMRDEKGNPIQASGRAGFNFFKNVDFSDTNVIVVTTADGTQVRLPRTRVYSPAIEVIKMTPSVAANAQYNDALRVVITDTTWMMSAATTYEAYKEITGTTLTTATLDGGYTQEPVLLEFTATPSGISTRYIISFRIPFHTGPSATWDTSRKTRVAVFLQWNQTNTIMNVAEFNNI